MPSKTQDSNTRAPVTPPETVEGLLEAVVARHPELSRRLRQFAKFVIDHPNDMAIETISVLAARSHVQPSAIVRFAKEFGYSGASEMQRVFRNKLLGGLTFPSYRERLRAARRALPNSREPLRAILDEIVHQNIVALEHLHDGISERDLLRVAEYIDRASIVYVTARRRSFSVAASIAYMLLRFGKTTQLIDGIAGLDSIQSEILTKRDLLIAISFAPYAEETIRFFQRASELKCKRVVLTDSRLSPLVGVADVALVVNEAELRGFRSNASSSVLAQALMLGYAFHQQRKHHRKSDPSTSE